MLETVSAQVLHKLDYMIHSKPEDHHDDFDPEAPLDYERTLSVSAGGTAEAFVYMTRDKRAKLTITLHDYDDAAPTATVIYHNTPEQVEEKAISLEKKSDGSYSCAFPDDNPAGECLLCFTLQNTTSWFSATSIRYSVAFTS